MDLMPDDLRTRLLANGAVGEETDHLPVVKYFDPCGPATWIITELTPTDAEGVEPDILFGLCDLGFGCPELGYVSVSELRNVRGRLGLGIERDLYFNARYPLSVYAHAAARRGRIVESKAALAEAAAILGIAPVDQSAPGDSNLNGSTKRG